MRSSLCLPLLALLAPAAVAQGSDDCATAQPLGSALGPHAFDNNGATTAQTGLCTTINSNVWFAWTAPATSRYFVQTCGQSSLDTKLAVYDGLGCPPAVALGCNDDACSLQSRVAFDAVAGNAYLIEVGSFSTTTQGSGTFVLFEDPCATLADDHLEENDDCPTARPMGSGSEVDLFVAKSDEDWYELTVADGATVDVDALFIHASGDIDIALWSACGGSTLDTSVSVTDNEDVSWTNNTGATATIYLRVYVWSGSGIDCNDYDLVISGAGPSGPGSNYCTSTPNSTGSPAVMSATGSASIADADLTLAASPVPNQPYLFFYGPTQVQMPFGNGFLCASGGITRLTPVAAASDNLATRAVDLAHQGIAPGTLNFQCWFRDPAGAGAAFNTSDGYSITFVP